MCPFVCVVHVECHVCGSQEANFRLVFTFYLVWDKIFAGFIEYTKLTGPRLLELLLCPHHLTLGVQGLQAPAAMSDCMWVLGIWTQVFMPCTKHFIHWSSPRPLKRAWTNVSCTFSLTLTVLQCKPLAMRMYTKSLVKLSLIPKITPLYTEGTSH